MHGTDEQTKEANNEKESSHNKKIADELKDKFPERSNLIDGTLTALLAQEHVLMLGPPGTAKSLFARRVAEATAEGSFFDVLLTKFTTVEEVYGPISFSLLKQDKYQRMLDGYAATKRIWFFDEIFKASSAILNCNLTAMNERQFHNGGSPEDIPLEMLIGASNEYPQDDSLKALFDRFTFKYWVDYISDRDQMAKLLAAGGVEEMKTVLNEGELEELRAIVKNVKFENGTIDTLLNIKASVEEEGFIVSDRIWVKAVKIIKARAVFKGRDNVISTDFMVLADMLWKEHKDRDRLNTIIGNAADPYGSRAIAIIDAVKTAMRDLPDISVLKSGQKTKVEFLKAITEVNGQIASRRDAILDAESECKENNDSITEAKEVVSAAVEQVDKLMKEVMFYREKK